MDLKRHDYATREALAEALAAGVAAVLAGGIATNGSAVLAVSGGSTPKLFLQHLAMAGIDWDKVTVCLVDERWVPDTNPRSNAQFLRENFLRGKARAARLEVFYEAEMSAEEAQAKLAQRFGSLPRPFDAAVLGMGTDGHTASFFPGGDHLARALDLSNPEAVISMEAPGAGEPRVTLTLSRLADARFLALHIEGEDKRTTLEAALQPGPVEAMPVRAVLALRRPEPVQIFWAP